MPNSILILDGQHNHHIWPSTSEVIFKFLDETSLFTVKRLRAQRNTEDFIFDEFSQFDAVVMNYNPNPGPHVGPLWPETTRRSFEEYMQQGGGLVVLHAANNAFAHWIEFNQMTGIGGWGGRTVDWGPYIYFDDQDNPQRDPALHDHRVGTDGPPHEFQIQIRDSNHPITNGMPFRWMHCMDEIYERLRGPANNLNVLGTAYSDSAHGHGAATQRHEPVIMTIDYHAGRVFHTTLGHWTYSWQCVGLVTLLQRGVEWAASGNVTQAIPNKFPTENTVSYRKLDWPDYAVYEWTQYH
jgi:type 1 glutamine amidotransferase